MTTILSVSGLVKRFGGFNAVDNLSLMVNERGIHSLIGPNGAGKTTLFHCLTGVLMPDAGRVSFRGQEVTRWPARKRVRVGMARTFQITSLFLSVTARENVELALRSIAGRNFDIVRPARWLTQEFAKAEALLDNVGIAHLGDRLAGELSHGDQRALEVAVALALDPQILFLDEPTAGMAREEVGRLSDVLETLGKRIAVLLVEHDTAMVLRISDRVTVMAAGRILADGRSDEISKNADVAAVYLSGSSTASFGQAVGR
jgi:ABC-type branched-subunit amino acid transport system ATPase component